MFLIIKINKSVDRKYTVYQFGDCLAIQSTWINSPTITYNIRIVYSYLALTDVIYKHISVHAWMHASHQLMMWMSKFKPMVVPFVITLRLSISLLYIITTELEIWTEFVKVDPVPSLIDNCILLKLQRFSPIHSF